MATVLPFRALRPRPDKAAAVSSPPYDVLSAAEAAVIIAGNPETLLRVTKPEAELSGTDPYAAQVYDRARARLAEMTVEGLLVQDTVAAFYVYRLQMGAQIQTGIAAVFSVDDYNAGRIKKHELTRPDKENDRTRHIEASGAQTGPAFLAYRANGRLNDIVAAATCAVPEYDFIASDGIRHTLWVIADADKCEAVSAAFEMVPELYIADGHHRSAAAARVAAEQPGNSEAGKFLAVAFPHDQLKIMDYNRVVRDLNGLEKKEFLERLAQVFKITAIGKGCDVDGKPAGRHVFGMYLDGCWYVLRATQAVINEDDCQARLDVNILQHNVLTPLLGIQDPRTDKRIDFVGGIRGMKELEKLVDSGTHAVAFSLWPPSMDELLAIADNGEIMPPKSTWFEPKLRDGMVINLI